MNTDNTFTTKNTKGTEVQVHWDVSPGLVNGEPKVEEVSDGLGGRCWKATAPIGSIFGSPVEGECEGIGRTREEALARLKQDQQELYESLWG
jgi:hypothetical protein